LETQEDAKKFSVVWEALTDDELCALVPEPDGVNPLFVRMALSLVDQVFADDSLPEGARQALLIRTSAALAESVVVELGRRIESQDTALGEIVRKWGF